MRVRNGVAMDFNKPVKSAALSPQLARVVGLICLTLGGFLLIAGTSLLASDEPVEHLGVMHVVLGLVLAALGVGIDRDSIRSMSGNKEEPNA